MLLWEKIAPSHVGKGGFAPIMRLTGAIGLGAGFLLFYQRSIRMPSSTPFPPSSTLTFLVYSAILRLDGKQARNRDGHERDGYKSEE